MHDSRGDTFSVTTNALDEATVRSSYHGWKPGDVIANGLEIRDLIGQGGMGVVWRVHHREWNRELAVKMPLPALVGSPTARDRFLREAETWIDLGVHPHIVQCWFVKDISGLPSLFLDFLTGGSLKQWLQAGHVRPGQWQRILEISIQVAEGLAYAHSRGVVHRDVKPANLLIRGDERVCVTDFGIVKTANEKSDSTPVAFRREDLPDDVSLTGTGAFLGTPQYGAPEQWGAAEGVDHAADIYALGVTIYEMCCGRRPFDCDEVRVAPEVLIERHLDAKPPDPREFYPDVPPELAHLVLLCLEKDRRKRPHDMERLKGALSTIYERLVSRPYKGVGAVPKEQRADTLNNRGVSLHSLAKPREARDVWRRGLRIESGHPECLYNLTKLELSAGRIDGEEALRRLRQARAGLPLALMCIEEGEFPEALETLQQVSSEGPGASLGQIFRAMGDAQMYSQQYYAAEKAYRSALNEMPADTLSHERKRLASLGRRGLLGKILFPSADSVFNVVLTDPTMMVTIDEQSAGVIGVGSSSAVYWNIEEQCVEHRVNRNEGSGAPIRLRCSNNLLLCEDHTSFELRRLPNLALVGRKSGRIVAATSTLSKLLVKEKKGVFIFDVARSELKRLNFPDGVDLKDAVFDLTGELLCILTDHGRIAQPDDDGSLLLEDWPVEVARHATVSSLALSHQGSHLYVGHACGRLQALNFADRAVSFELSFGQPVEEILTTHISRRFVVRLQQGFVILEPSGEILFQGSGCAVLDRLRGQVLVTHQGQLQLHSLTPFRRLRLWRKHQDAITHLTFARDGRRAVSQSGTGRFDVWEVDEENRVHERSFLLSPGKSFAEICSASQRFSESLAACRQALEREQLASSYRHLQRARSVDGYAQRPEALDLNWQLLSALRRDRLESVWERISLECKTGATPGPLALLGEGERLLTTFGGLYELYKDDGNETKQVWSRSSKRTIIALRVLDDSLENEALLVDSKGECWKVDLDNGEPTDSFSIAVGPLNKAVVTALGVIFLSADGDIGFYDLHKRSVLGTFGGLGGQDFKVFPWQPYSAIVGADTQFFKIDLRGRNPKPQHVRLKGFEPSSPITYASPSKNGQLYFLGFEDGALLICDNKENPLAQLGPADGAITGFHFFPFLSAGVTATRHGKLSFWDLHTNHLLGEFNAHRGSVNFCATSPTCRYLLTAGSDDQVRLWESSWTAVEEEGELPLEWMSTSKPMTKFGRLFGFGGR